MTAGKEPKKGPGAKGPDKGGAAAKSGKPAEEKKMMTYKEAFDAIKDYMIKVCEILSNHIIFSKIGLIL